MNGPEAVRQGEHITRWLSVRGVVQGVGFRPHVWRLAEDLGLSGWVRNTAAGVEIRIEGEAATVEDFTRRLACESPPLARIDAIDWQDQPLTACRPGGFAILASGSGAAATMIGHDTAVCADCLAELFDPSDRRWRYPFINCTHCGPRYTITRALPYDRAQTSMAAFPLCPDCAREYQDPADRRFHAEPIACPACGPHLWLEGLSSSHPTPHAAADTDPIAQTLALLQAGAIVAIKGLGGFHLACDARNAAAVARLRRRKSREEKPFALMAANAASIAAWAEIGAAETALLTSPERPIVLLRKRRWADAAFPGVAPGLAWLGVMLPYTPLHWLIFHEAAGRPTGTAWIQAAQDLVLVMTSANPGGEPLVIANDEARTRLAGIADALLLNDRDIVVRCDDSVVRLAPSPRAPHPVTAFIRRARGYTPHAIRLPVAGPPVLALGGHYKNTVCVTRGDEAYVSQHIGDLDSPAACAMLLEVTRHLTDILQVRPAALAHDLHPDFFSTRHAQTLAQSWGVPVIAVQHHHAHIAAIAAEHGIEGPLLGLALDGVGLGHDGKAWGGELLRVQGAACARLGHLQPLPLPGGDRAAREPWRVAAAVLHLLGRGDEIPRRFAGQPLAAAVQRLLADDTALPTTTSLGRCFDAAAGLLGVREVMAFEGQAAMLLEGMAETTGVDALPSLPDGWRLTDSGDLDLLPLLARLADETDAARGAVLFHVTLAHALADWVGQAAACTGIDRVALAGGCLLNAILTRLLTDLLTRRGLHVFTAHQVPPNDGGLSLGQAWVAIQALAAAA